MSDAPQAKDEMKNSTNDTGKISGDTVTRVTVEHSSYTRPARRWLSPLPLAVALAAIVALIVIVWLVSSRTKAQPEEEAVVEVEVAVSTRTEMREYVEAQGTLNAMPGHEASFSAATAGRVTRVLVQVGDHVRVGQTLAELDRSVPAAQVRQAQAALQQARATATQARTSAGAQSQTIASDQIRQAEVALAEARANQTQAQNNLARLERLFERGIAARKEVEDAQTQVKLTTGTVTQTQSALDAARASATRGIGEARTQASVSASGAAGAEAALGVARAELARASIRSPINGTVTRRAINDGETVDPATPAFEVVDASSLDLIANVPAPYLGRLKTGDLVIVKVEPFPDKEFSGGVVNVAPSVDPQTNTVAVRVRLPNPNGELKSGLYADARIAVEIHPDAVVVPESALVVEGDETFVFVAGEGDKVEKRKVEVGIRDGGRAEIIDGLKENERVVTTGAFGLSDGAKIKVVEPSGEDEKGADKKSESKSSAGSEP